MRTLDEDLEAAREFHGHLCHGQLLGVRMARMACAELGIDDPQNYRDLIVYVEMDRCAADAVCVVTGCTLGRRRLKFVDYGKLATTFVDLASGRAVRVCPGKAAPHGPRDVDVKAFWEPWRDEEIFELAEVSVQVPPEDLPGRPTRKAICERCGEQVMDGREVHKGEEVLCKACADRPYYERVTRSGRGVSTQD